jgi:hypothetical protein
VYVKSRLVVMERGGRESGHGMVVCREEKA